jgi:DNA adenine methylase
MKITAISPWFGSKRTLAPVIVSELGAHKAYWEPFCGSMAVLLSKPACRQETVVDLHGDLINLARVIQNRDTAVALYRRLRRTLMHEDALAEAAETLSDRPWSGDVPHVGRAWAFFVTSWMGRNGFVGTEGHARTATFCIRYTANGGDSATRFRGAVESIPQWRRRLRNVTILNRDAFGVIDKIADEDGCVVYCDPPYLVKGSKYVHDFDDVGLMGNDDHARLAAAVARFKRTRVIVSYYSHPRLSELYPGWTRRMCGMNKNMANTAGKGKDAPEVLLINGPSYQAEAA